MKKKLYFYTFGCKVNQYDTQKIRESMLTCRFELSDCHTKADIIVINSCTVTAESDRQCRQIIRRMLRENNSAEIAITGCYAKRANQELKQMFQEQRRVMVFGSIAEMLSNYKISKEKETVSNFSERSRVYLKIQDGCDHFCSYCVVPFVRSQNYSKPRLEVIREVSDLIKNGSAEIVLCGIRLGKYESGQDYRLENLLGELIMLKGNFRLRLSSIEVGEITETLLKLISENPEKICHHIHLPLQSGDDKILRLMNRPYSISEYGKKVTLIKEYLPEVALTTDVIFGFPGETDESIENTCAALKNHGFRKVHIFPYSRRPGTTASKLKHAEGNAHEYKLKEWKKKLFEINKILQLSARAVSESKKHKAITIGDGWILTEDYQYFRIKDVPDQPIFEFDPKSQEWFG